MILDILLLAALALALAFAGLAIAHARRQAAFWQRIARIVGEELRAEQRARRRERTRGRREF